MNHTEHYQLSQWEKSDRILMDDFNADNAKIDAALANARSLELLYDRFLKQEPNAVAVDVSQVEWNRYAAVILVTHGMIITNTLTIDNGLPNQASYTYGKEPMESKHLFACNMFQQSVTVIPVFYNGDRVVFAFTVTDNFMSADRSLSVGSSNGRVKEIQAFTVDPGDIPFYETAIQLWGVR